MIDENKLNSFMSGIADTVVFDKIDSTNAEAKRQAAILFEKGRYSPVLFLAREQSAGRGRMNRSFLSRANRGIFMSLLYFTESGLSSAVSVTTAAASIVAQAIEKVTSRDMRIKWVNDIYNDRGKVCGILTETLPVGLGVFAVIVGIGINIGEDDFPEELRDIASSIGNICGKEEELIADIASGLVSHLGMPDDRGYMAEYRKRFMLMGEEVNLLQNGDVTGSGRVVGVDDDGGLLIAHDGDSKGVSIRSGEVSVRIK
jgi:BirA family biotin operon repressor/biotin-[acetyl-CoA-carboxylase] ligase